MSLYSDETKRLIARDVKAWQAAKDEATDKIAEALEGLDDARATQVLEGCLHYGWRRPDGEWRNSPKFKRAAS